MSLRIKIESMLIQHCVPSGYRPDDSVKKPIKALPCLAVARITVDWGEIKESYKTGTTVSVNLSNYIQIISIPCVP